MRRERLTALVEIAGWASWGRVLAIGPPFCLPPSMKSAGGWLFLQRHLHEPQHGSLSALDILVELHRKLIFNTANVPQAGKPPL